MRTRSIREQKQYLKDRMVDYQRQIARLSGAMKEQQDSFRRREKELLVDIFEVLDAFDNLEKAYGERAGTLDKTSARLLKSVNSIGRKLRRTLKGKSIVPIAFPEGKVRMEHCRIVDTRRVPDAENETIVSIEKTGYIDVEKDQVLRKADVVTVLNE